MVLSSSNLLIVALAYPPATGGASIYTKLLVEGLFEQGFSGNIFVLAEAYPGYPKEEILWNGKLHLFRIFPFRSEMSRQNWLRYFKYVYQNLQFLILPFWVNKFKITHLLVHTNYYYYSSSISLVINIIRFFSNSKLIADVRDLKMPLDKFKKLYIYHDIICSSENVYYYLVQDSTLSKKLNLIPIPLKISIITSDFIQTCKNKFGIADKNYIFSASGIIKEKNIALTLEVVGKLKAKDENIILVVAGKKKDWNYKCQNAVDTGLLKYIGVIINDEVLALAKGAELVINLSPFESPSRYSLEAIAVGAKVLLPPGVPEFDRACSDKVMISDDANKIAEQALALLKEDNYYLNYNLESHLLKNVIPQYLKLLS